MILAKRRGGRLLSGKPRASGDDPSQRATVILMAP